MRYLVFFRYLRYNAIKLDLTGIFVPKLINAENAIIETEKLRNYILSPAHPIGRYKAAFFLQLGYSIGNWQELKINLRNLILVNDAIRSGESLYGEKFIVDGIIRGPNSVEKRITTVWVILKNENVPRFITAYPGGSK
jgi:hypothetical protein